MATAIEEIRDALEKYPTMADAALARLDELEAELKERAAAAVRAEAADWTSCPEATTALTNVLRRLDVPPDHRSMGRHGFREAQIQTFKSVSGTILESMRSHIAANEAIRVDRPLMQALDELRRLVDAS